MQTRKKSLNKIKKRDLSIEAMRIIACFFVICIHISNTPLINGSLNKTSVFLNCVFADAVAMFWFITGAFLFNNHSYLNLLKSTFKKIIMPAVLLIVIIFFLDGWVFKGQSITESINSSFAYISSALECLLLKWSTPVAHTGQLWYVFTYLLVIICSPAIKSFVDIIDKKHTEKVFLIISFALLFLNDLSNNQLANFNHSAFNSLFPAIIFTIWGHIFYKNKDKLIKKIKSFYPMLVFIGLAIIRALIIIIPYYFGDNDLNKSILYWFSCFALLTSTSLFFFLKKILRNVKNNSAIFFITKIGSYTFIIYLLHELVIDYLKKIGFYQEIQKTFLSNANPLNVVLYYITLSLIVFTISLVISIILRSLHIMVNKLLYPKAD